MCYTNDDSSSSSSTSSTATANTSSNGSSLMIWASQLNEPKNERDAGMMPPPTTTLPLNIRRSSLTGMLSCSSTDQISPPILKSEIIDENSQNSIISTGPDTLNHDSMDHFPNESSLDGSNSASSQVNMLAPTPLELIMQKATGFSTALNQSNLMEIATATQLNVVDLRVKQEEQIAAHIQELVNQNSSDNNDLLSAVNHSNERNFLSSLGAKINDLKAQVEGVPMFASATINGNNSSDVMFTNRMNTLGHNVVPTTPSDHQMQQTIDQTNSFASHQGLMTEAGTATTLNHILSYPNPSQSLSPNILSTSPSSTSPLSQDVMLNSQPAAALNTSPTMMSVTTGSTSTMAPIAITTTQSESDIILNPTISPTMMCQNANNDGTNLMANPVTIGDPTMLSSQQPTSEALLTNLMQPMSIKQSPVDVKNMILNAAADILSSEPNSITPETTMNALMSLNSAPLISQDQTPQPTASSQSSNGSNTSVGLINMHDTQSTSSMMMPAHHHFENTATQSISDILSQNDPTSSVVVLAGNNQLIQNVVAAAAAQNASDIIQNQMVSTDSMLGSYSNHLNPQILNVHTQVTTTTANSNNYSQAQHNFLNNLQ